MLSNPTSSAVLASSTSCSIGLIATLTVYCMGYAEVVDDVTRLFRSDRKDEAAKIIPDELVDDSAIVGNLAYVQEQIKAWEAAGVTMMVVGARSPEQIRDLAGLV